jgi:hypothetical protein
MVGARCRCAATPSSPCPPPRHVMVVVCAACLVVSGSPDGPAAGTRAAGRVARAVQLPAPRILRRGSAQGADGAEGQKAGVHCCAPGCRRRPVCLIAPPTADRCDAATEAGARASRYFCGQHSPALASRLKCPSQRCQYRGEATNSSRERTDESTRLHNSSLVCGDGRASDGDTGALHGTAESACSRWPSYGDPVERRPRFCREHAAAGHVNLKARRCRALGCTRQPSFGGRDSLMSLRLMLGSSGA